MKVIFIRKAEVSLFWHIVPLINKQFSEIWNENRSLIVCKYSHWIRITKNLVPISRLQMLKSNFYIKTVFLKGIKDI